MGIRFARVPAWLLALFIATSVLPLQQVEAQSESDSADSNTPFSAQICDQWCWASTVEMIGAQLGKSLPQCQVVSFRYNAPGHCCAPGACSTLCDQGSGGPDVLTGALQYWGIHGSYAQYPLAADVLRAALGRGRPVIAATLPHAIVISAYRKVDGVYLYKVLDPNAGVSWHVYEDLLGYGGYAWVFSWWDFYG